MCVTCLLSLCPVWVPREGLKPASGDGSWDAGADAWHREIGFGEDRSNEARGRRATAKSSLQI